MPGPAVYVVAAMGAVGAVAVGIAFHQFVYEPLIAPKLEALAESFLENRRQRSRRPVPVPAARVNEHGDENGSRRSNERTRDNGDQVTTSIELEQLAASERAAWRHATGASTSGLRHRRTAGALDESNASLPHRVLTPSQPTHILFDSSAPSSPGGFSSGEMSFSNSPAQPSIGLSTINASTSKSSAPPQDPHHRLPTPVSERSVLSPVPRAATPRTAQAPRFPLSARESPEADLAASRFSAYTTPIAGSLLDDDSHLRGLPQSGSRIQSPFSDIHSADARSSPEAPAAACSPVFPASPSVGSDLTLDSDEEFDVMSPRSAMFSPPAHAEDIDPFELASHGSEASWASVGRRSPVDF
ncbi:uncharacterized protein BXZ73DRAFT_43765 [Epithele typhae]|uniref:uncharacterized protein n=1 Tax=Epithele typhae TaxID=378194 RepID=UPI00200806B9|nr:uncharacterized protein BXZ73DRAFT_43765 [Epithele typhae]KAH9939270.1 hypothetical protein BXZ73DRAFT_43765 [Epithele typhae]